MHEDQLIAEDIDAFLKKQEMKELLRFVTIGSVDDGKSTLIGRLLHDSVGIFEDLLKDVAAGEGGIDLARITDGLQAEREQGITIDVAYRYFSTPARKFILADTPGHVQYTRNMATGSSTADVAIILIDARYGVLEQSRRHAYITSLLGIRNLAVCINKMDLIGFDQRVFDAIAADFSGVAKQLRFEDVRLFPISALLGDNVVKPSDRTPWYSGGTLLRYLETVPIGDARRDFPFRMPVQTAIRPNLDYRGFAGQVASGRIAKGDPIMVMPSGKTSRVAGIDLFDRELEEAVPPLSVTIRLEDEIDVSRGDVLVDPTHRPEVSRRIEAALIWMNERPLDPGRSYLLKHTTETTRAFIDELVCCIDLDSLSEQPIDAVGLNDIARVRLRTNRPLVFDPYEENRTTGAFVLIDSVTNDTVGAGMILGARDPSESEVGSQISEAERAERLRQKGAVIRVAAKERARSEALAYALERALFDLGYLPAVTREDAEVLAQAGLLAICPATKGDPSALQAPDDASAAEAADGFVALLRARGLLR
jgi:bifunctional enzyme CysN/CysC/sulfate adenylyltransferase subunit 1